MEIEIEKPDKQTLVQNLDPTEYRHTARDFLSYFRINAHTSRSLQIIAEILKAFIHIPYENLSKIIKYHNYHHDTASLRLPDEVWQDFRNYRLGGTCFSLTFFLRAIVDALGFTSYPVMAHMQAGRNRHCALIVDFRGKHYLLDPGYVLDVPLLIDNEQRKLYRSAHAGVELRAGDLPLHYNLYTFTQEKIQWRYSFADIPVSDADFLRRWLDSFSWNGMNGVCLTQARKDSLIFIHKYFMRETKIDGKQNYNLKRNREQVIQEIFGIPSQFVEAAEAALQERMAKYCNSGCVLPQNKK
ncbi:MAG: arylamine N-acetyltransferase [bacterium]